MAGFLIKGGRLLDPASLRDEHGDILIDEGTIVRTAPVIDRVPEGTEVIDAQGLWVMPGLVDLHVHFRDPGLTYKETIATGSMAAAAGGFTTVCAMPNTKPVVDRPQTVAYVLEQSHLAPYTRVLPIGAITIGQLGEELVDFAALKEAGICAVSEDGRSVASSRLMKEAMIRCRDLGIPVFDHCEDPELAGGCMNEGEVSCALGLPGLSRDAENVMTAREILLAESTRAKLHICHVSTAECVEMIRFAKARGVCVTAEVCPHHFSLSEEDILREPHSKYKMNPPLRTMRDVEALRQGLADGTIDAIATDHAPHSDDEKTADMLHSMNGIIGLETAFAVSKQYLVDTGLLTPLELVRRMSLNPAHILGLPLGTLSEGAAADICLADPECEYIVPDRFFSKASNSPYTGRRLRGRIWMTIQSGRPVYRDGAIALR